MPKLEDRDSMQVCVPKHFTDWEVKDYADEKNPSGTVDGWAIRKASNPRLLNTLEREQCPMHPHHVHIILEREVEPELGESTIFLAMTSCDDISMMGMGLTKDFALLVLIDCWENHKCEKYPFGLPKFDLATVKVVGFKPGQCATFTDDPDCEDNSGK